MAKTDGILLEELESQQEEFVEIETPDFEATYANIKQLIFTGFIPVRVKYGKLDLVLKAVTPKEYEYIDLISQTDRDKVPLYFLYSLVLVGNQEVIPHRKELHDYITNLFNKLPGALVTRLYTLISQVQEHYSSCYEHLEAYLYERESRYRWDVYKTKILNSTLLDGMGDAGYNTAQEVWVGFNQREDERSQMDVLFANAKFIASAFAGAKEIKRIERLEKMRENEENLRRQNVRLKNKITKLQLTKPITTAKDLVDELKRQIAGEKDLHDKLIEIHERKMAKEAQERKERLEELQLQARLNNTQAARTIQGGSKPVTPQEMKDQMEQSQRKKANYQPKEDYFVSKVYQTSHSRNDAKPAPKPAPAPATDQKKSIFDPEVQKGLLNINIKNPK